MSRDLIATYMYIVQNLECDLSEVEKAELLDLIDKGDGNGLIRLLDGITSPGGSKWIVLKAMKNLFRVGHGSQEFVSRAREYATKLDDKSYLKLLVEKAQRDTVVRPHAKTSEELFYKNLRQSINRVCGDLTRNIKRIQLDILLTAIRSEMDTEEKNKRKKSRNMLFDALEAAYQTCAADHG